MLGTNPRALYEEIKAAERLREKHTSSMGEQVEKYTGPYYKDGGPYNGYAAENHYYEFISLVVPRLVFDNPRVRVETRRPGTQGLVAQAMKHGLNRWVRDSNLRKVLTDVAVDMCFNFGVALITEEKNKGLRPALETQTPATPMWPVCTRIPQHRFFVDPVAESIDQARFIGHKWVRDKEDLLQMAEDDKDAGWNADAIEKMSATTDNRELGRDEKDLPDREEVVCYEVYVPEVELDDSLGEKHGFNGTIYTLAVAVDDEDEKAAFIRDPRPYYGPRWGPYVIFGIYKVPNQIFPLSPLVAIEGQVEELNRHAESASVSAEMYKKLILVDNTDPKFVQRVKDAQDNYVIPVSGLEKQRVVQAEIGGMTQQQLSYLQVARDRLDRNSGITDAQRGNIEGRGTATEVTVAAEASTVRMAFMKREFSDAVQQVLKTVAWFLYHDDRVVMPLGQEAEREMGIEEPWLVGGDHDPDGNSSFDDLELEIDPYSMERTTEGTHQRRTLDMYNLVLQAAPMIPQMPFINWKEVFSKLGDALNQPDLGSLVDVDMAMAMAQLQGQEPQAQRQPQPRFGKDIGTAGKARPKITEAGKGGITDRVNPNALAGIATGTEAQRQFQGGAQ